MTRRRGIRWTALLSIVAVVGIASASVAAAAPPAGVSMEGTGPQAPGVGMFSKDALAQPNCADNGRMAGATAGGGVYCVNTWPAGKSNGGATAPGVTATEVKVIAYAPNDQMIAANTSPAPTDQATGKTGKVDQAVKDFLAAYNAAIQQNDAYQLWGRKPVVEVYTASGADETAQRADAVAVIAKKPFMVADLTGNSTGAAVFSQLVAAKHIMMISASTDATTGAEQAPYRWSYAADTSSAAPMGAALIGKVLGGKAAEFAGDALKSKQRSFGVVYPTTGFDIDAFDKYLGQNGGKVTDKLSFDLAAVTAGSADLGTLVQKLKADGVTSVVLFADRATVQKLMAAATAQDYVPEWIYTGYLFQEYTSLARANDPQQMAHAFGLAQIGPYITDSPTLAGTIFSWYWGSTLGTNFPPTSALGMVYQMMHYAGPTLTAKNIQKGLFAAPATKSAGVSIGLSGFGKTVGTPYTEYANFGSDRALIWWDANTEGQALATPVGKGVWQYLNNGESMTYSQLQKANPKYFDKSASVTTRSALDYYPGHVAPTLLPCSGCPSTGTAAPSS